MVVAKFAVALLMENSCVINLDRMLEEIEQLGGVEDVDYTATLADGTVEFTGFVEAASLTEAQWRFLSIARNARRNVWASARADVN